MTTRNLNQTWRDVVFQQYARDHAADVPFPVRYLIHAPEWHKDIFIEIPTKIDERTLRRSVLDFAVSRRGAEPVFSNEYISVRPRVSWRDRAPGGGGDDTKPQPSQEHQQPPGNDDAHIQDNP